MCVCDGVGVGVDMGVCVGMGNILTHESHSHRHPHPHPHPHSLILQSSEGMDVRVSEDEYNRLSVNPIHPQGALRFDGE